MKGHQTFLERIASAGEGGLNAQSADEDPVALMESVRQHVTRLLNARHGMSQALPDYGLPAMADLTVGTGDYVQRVQEAIRNTIEKYEPRLRAVRVTRDPEAEAQRSQKLVFAIEGIMVGRNSEHRIRFETAVAGSEEFDLSD